MAETPAVVTRNVSLDSETDEIVEAVNTALPVKNYSAAIRLIVREWQALKFPISSKTAKAA